MFMRLDKSEKRVEYEITAFGLRRGIGKDEKDFKGKISKMESWEVNLTYFTILPGTTKTW